MASLPECEYPMSSPRTIRRGGFCWAGDGINEIKRTQAMMYFFMVEVKKRYMKKKIEKRGWLMNAFHAKTQRLIPQRRNVLYSCCTFAFRSFCSFFVEGHFGRTPPRMNF